MKLEHRDLTPVEPILSALHRLVFEGGIEALQKAGLLRASDERKPDRNLPVASRLQRANARTATHGNQL